MVWSSLRLDSILEPLVLVFQVVGVMGLCATRLMPATRWAARGRVGYIVALVGLGMTGALCGRQDSEFALFAGGTMTLLLIGMTIGSGQTDSAGTSRTNRGRGAEAGELKFFRRKTHACQSFAETGPRGPVFFCAPI